MGGLPRPRTKAAIRCTYGGGNFCQEPSSVMAFRPFTTGDGGTYSPVCTRHGEALSRRGGKIVRPVAATDRREAALSLDS